MKLSKNFSLRELTRSETAIRNGIDNIPDHNGVSKLTQLAQQLLQPIRDHFGKPVKVSSGYRSKALEKIICNKSYKFYLAQGSAAVEKWLSRKGHVQCEAADIEIQGVDNKDLYNWIVENMEFDRVFLEYYEEGIPDSGWVHVSYNSLKNKNIHSHIG